MSSTELSSLDQIYKRYQSKNKYFSFSGDKGTYHSYIDFYQEKFKSFKLEAINFLEIGVYDGQSLAMFNEYFPNGNMYGVDITDQNLDSNFKSSFNFHHGHQSQQSTYKGLPKFQIIIDDGSGKLQDQVNTLRFLYFKLKFKGTYYIEDISDIHIAKKEITKLNKNAIFYDFRNINERFDNILVAITKPLNIYTLYLHYFSMLRYYKNIYKSRQKR